MWHRDVAARPHEKVSQPTSTLVWPVGEIGKEVSASLTDVSDMNECDFGFH